MRWYVGQSKAGKLSVAIEALGSQGFVLYVPQIVPLIGAARRPMFGRYFFFSPFNPVAASTRGVHRIVAADPVNPPWLPHGYVELLAAAIIGAKAPDFVVGEEITLRSGMRGTFNGRDERGRIRLLLSLLGRENETVVSDGAVARQDGAGQASRRASRSVRQVA